MWTDRGDGEKVKVIGVWDGPEEARRVGEEAERHEGAGKSLDDIAILVRAQFQTREFEERFIAIGLNYQIIGGFRFYERAEIRDAIAYLRLIAQPADDLAFERIVNTPKRGLGDKAVATIHRHAARHAAAPADGRRPTPRQRRTHPAGPPQPRQFRRRHRPLARTLLPPGEVAARGRRRGPAPHPELARIVLDESGYTAALQADRSRRGRGPPRKPRRADPRDGGI